MLVGRTGVVPSGGRRRNGFRADHVQDVVASVVVGNCRRGGRRSWRACSRSVPASTPSRVWRAATAACTTSANVTATPPSTATRSVRGHRRAGVEAVRRLSPEWTALTRSRPSSRTAAVEATGAHGQTSEPPRAGPAVCPARHSGLLPLTSPRAAPRARVDVIEDFVQVPPDRVRADLDGLWELAERHVLVDRGRAQIGEFHDRHELDQLPPAR